MGATAELAEFSINLESGRIPNRAREEAVRSFTDCLGVALAGLSWPSSKMISSLVKREAASGPAVVIGQGFRAQPAMAALANGTIIHALDYDDMGLSIGHPSAAVIPAALAVAETVGATGPELIDAIVVGFEVGARIGESAGGTQGPYAQGFHGTPIYGVFGAAAAAGRLLGLDVDQLRRAFGIAASEASGVRANFGTHAKPYHAGECNRAGVVAAYLAKEGFVADPNALETKYGWADAICGGHYDTGKLTEKLGQSFALEEGAEIKRYPCCGANHSAINAVTKLMQRENLKPDDVESVEVHQSRYSANEILIYPWPSVGLEGKFCLAFNVAEAWRNGTVTVESFTDERLAELNPYRSKINIVGEDGKPPVLVKMHLTDGRTVEYEALGFGDNNPDKAEIEEKFRANAARAGRQNRAEEMLSRAWAIEELGSLQELTSLFE